ncbi:MAG: hypothetical protein WA161_15420 [Pseudomonas sp.]|uniref:hypothetical protein n=1 Tax=Pseudomonas sp. TaxID=306 RepID=UPI003BB6DD1C
MANRLGSVRQQGLLPMPSGKHRRIVRLLAPPIIEPERPEIFERCLAALARAARPR